MFYNILDNTQKRRISSCNFNQHICAPHPDRIMDEHDLIYIKDGNWTIFQDDIRYDLIAGDVILLQSNHHHYGCEPCISTVKTRFIHFSSCKFDRICKETNNEIGQYIFPMIVHCRNNPLIEQYFNEIIHIYWSDEKYSLNKASSYLDLLLCEISDMTEKSGKPSSLIEDIKIIIRKTPERFWKNQELAEEFNCSVRTLTKRFKEETGYGIHEWQMKLKCEMAKELIKSEPSLTLKEVAVTFGFCDEYHFSKCYKRYFGYSPKLKNFKQVGILEE